MKKAIGNPIAHSNAFINKPNTSFIIWKYNNLNAISIKAAQTRNTPLNKNPGLSIKEFETFVTIESNCVNNPFLVTKSTANLEVLSLNQAHDSPLLGNLTACATKSYSIAKTKGRPDLAGWNAVVTAIKKNDFIQTVGIKLL